MPLLTLRNSMLLDGTLLKLMCKWWWSDNLNKETCIDQMTCSQLCDDNLDIPEPKTTDDVAQLYFEVFNIQPVKLNLSFVRTQGANIVDER